MYRKLRKHVHGRILTQLGIIIAAALVLSVAVVVDAIIGGVGPAVLLLAAAAGLAAGFLSARMFALRWHEETEKVIMRMDRTSLLLIGLYIAFRIGSSKLLGSYFTGAALSAISFAALDGILAGRFASMWRSIRAILREQRI